jgi:hypothetical protein
MFFGGREKFGSIEKKRFAIEYGDERRSVRACATWTLPPGRTHEVTRANAAFRVFQRSFEHEGLFSAVCSCNGTTAPGAILNRMVERPSSSRYRIFISIPSNAVRCQGIDDAATKVDLEVRAG